MVLRLWVLLALGCLCTVQSLDCKRSEKVAKSFLIREGYTSLTSSEVDDLEVSDCYLTKHNGVEHVYLKQLVHGLEIVNGQFHTNVLQDGEVIGGDIPPRHADKDTTRKLFFVPNATKKVVATESRLTPEEAIVAVRDQLEPLKEMPLSTFQNLVEKAKNDGKKIVVFEGGDLSLEDIPVTMVYYYIPSSLTEGELRLSYRFNIYLHTSMYWYDLVVDTETGHVHQVTNWVSQSNFEFLVYPAPDEAPFPGTRRELVVDPVGSEASPLGWLNDGTEKFTDSQGNNAIGREDTAGRNPRRGHTVQSQNGVFAPEMDLDDQQPSDYTDASVVNLFYWNNYLHDVLFIKGFDESAGNFQRTNFGGEGKDSDEVYAEAQDGSGTNNANFATPPDGQNPRMQMYVWTDPSDCEVDLKTGPNIPASSAVFGPKEDTPQAPLKIGQEDNGVTVDPHDPEVPLGCSPFVADSLHGTISLVKRGDCSFTDKVQNSQDAGAVGVIVINTENSLMSMGGDSNTIKIPSVMVASKEENELVREAEQMDGALIRQTGGRLMRDSDFDHGIIAHEYCHGLSIRLTGGPSDSDCLSTSRQNQQAGEGWSDFCALYVTARKSDQGHTLRGMGGYVLYSDPAATIRPAPYTTDMDENPYTYGSLNAGTLSMPHGIGFVWCTAVWEVYWELVEKYGFDDNLDNPEAGNNMAMQLIVDGLKFQPCSPNFLDARNAILEADKANYGAANQCEIWRGFAKRGMGMSAESYGGTSVEEAFDFPSHC